MHRSIRLASAPSTAIRQAAPHSPACANDGLQASPSGSERSSKPQAAMSGRSSAWLLTRPSLGEVRKAVAAIGRQVAAGQLTADEEVEATVDLLTEYFVDQGGDLCDLPCIGAPLHPVGQTAAPPQSTADHLFDASPLCPDIPAAVPVLSQAEKRRAFEQLRGQLCRPGHF